MTGHWKEHTLAAEMEIAVAAVREAGRLCRAVQTEIDLGALANKTAAR